MLFVDERGRTDRVLLEHAHPELGSLKVREDADGVLVLGLDDTDYLHQLLAS